MAMDETHVSPDREPDRLGPVLHPLLFPLALLAIGLTLQWLAPLPALSRGTARLAGILALAPGLALMAAAAGRFRGAGTSPNPTRPTTALVTSGPYRFTRNPMYLGISLVYLGLALLCDAPWALLLLAAVVVALDVAVIRPEERFLTARFGDAYRDYAQRVRRWL
jgi:protein-S-isoprenylcysteine O-methyltransferase Ste14